MKCVECGENEATIDDTCTECLMLEPGVLGAPDRVSGKRVLEGQSGDDTDKKFDGRIHAKFSTDDTKGIAQSGLINGGFSVQRGRDLRTKVRDEKPWFDDVKGIWHGKNKALEEEANLELKRVRGPYTPFLDETDDSSMPAAWQWAHGLLERLQAGDDEAYLALATLTEAQGLDKEGFYKLCRDLGIEENRPPRKLSPDAKRRRDAREAAQTPS